MATRRKKAKRTTPQGSKWYLSLKEKVADLEQVNDKLRQMLKERQQVINDLEKDMDGEQIILLSLRGGVVKLERYFERGPPDTDDTA